MAVDINILRSELLTGSHASLYSATIAAGDYGALTILINAVSAPPSTLTVGLASAMSLQQQIVASEYLAISAGQRDLWNALLTTTAAYGTLAISNTLIRTQIGAVWSAGTTTRSNLSNLQIRSATRAEALFGEGTVIDGNTLYYAVTGT
jgi:hypothetical protein